MLAVIGLLLGLGGGTGFALMRARKPVAAAVDGDEKKEPAKTGEETPEDAARVSKPDGAERAASTLEDSSTSVTHADTKRASAPAVPSPAGHTPTVAVAASTTPGAAAAAKAPATDTSRAGAPAPGRIAKIFAAMSAKDAARVLQQLDDADVQTVLGGLNDKQAAAILSGFPPERAAAISRAALRGKKGTS